MNALVDKYEMLGNLSFVLFSGTVNGISENFYENNYLVIFIKPLKVFKKRIYNTRLFAPRP